MSVKKARIKAIYSQLVEWELDAAVHMLTGMMWDVALRDYPDLTAEQLVSLMLDGMEVPDVNPQTWGRA